MHKDIEKKFTEVAVETARKLKLGNGLDAGIEIGPMFEKKAMDGTIDLVEGCLRQGRKTVDRRQTLRCLRERVLLRADYPERIVESTPRS